MNDGHDDQSTYKSTHLSSSLSAYQRSKQPESNTLFPNILDVSVHDRLLHFFQDLCTNNEKKRHHVQKKAPRCKIVERVADQDKNEKAMAGHTSVCM